MSCCCKSRNDDISDPHKVDELLNDLIMNPNVIDSNLELKIAEWQDAINDYYISEQNCLEELESNEIYIIYQVRHNPQAFLDPKHSNILRNLAEKKILINKMQNRLGLGTSTIIQDKFSTKDESIHTKSQSITESDNMSIKPDTGNIVDILSSTWAKRLNEIDPIQGSALNIKTSHANNSPRLQIKPKWPNFLIDTKFDVIKINRIKQKIRQTLKLTQHHIITIKNGNEITKFYSLNEIKRTWLQAEKNTIHVVLKNKKKYIYLSPLAPHIVQQIITRVRVRLSLDKTELYSNSFKTLGYSSQITASIIQAINDTNTHETEAVMFSFANHLKTRTMNLIRNEETALHSSRSTYCDDADDYNNNNNSNINSNVSNQLKIESTISATFNNITEKDLHGNTKHNELKIRLENSPESTTSSSPSPVSALFTPPRLLQNLSKKQNNTQDFLRHNSISSIHNEILKKSTVSYPVVPRLSGFRDNITLNTIFRETTPRSSVFRETSLGISYYHESSIYNNTSLRTSNFFETTTTPRASIFGDSFFQRNSNFREDAPKLSSFREITPEYFVQKKVQSIIFESSNPEGNTRKLFIENFKITPKNGSKLVELRLFIDGMHEYILTKHGLDLAVLYEEEKKNYDNILKNNYNNSSENNNNNQTHNNNTTINNYIEKEISNKSKKTSPSKMKTISTDYQKNYIDNDNNNNNSNTINKQNTNRDSIKNNDSIQKNHDINTDFEENTDNPLFNTNSIKKSPIQILNTTTQIDGKFENTNTSISVFYEIFQSNNHHNISSNNNNNNNNNDEKHNNNNNNNDQSRILKNDTLSMSTSGRFTRFFSFSTSTKNNGKISFNENKSIQVKSSVENNNNNYNIDQGNASTETVFPHLNNNANNNNNINNNRPISKHETETIQAVLKENRQLSQVDDGILIFLSYIIFIVVEEAMILPLIEKIVELLPSYNKTNQEIRLLEKIKIFSSRTQSQWGIPDQFISPLNWHSAIFELSSIDFNLTPSAQLQSLTRAVKAIYNEFKLVVLPILYEKHEKSKLSGKGNNHNLDAIYIGADDLVPIFMYVFCQSNIKHPIVNRDLMWALCHPDQSQGETGYYLTVYESAIAFITKEKINSRSFSVSLNNSLLQFQMDSNFALTQNNIVRNSVRDSNNNNNSHNNNTNTITTSNEFRNNVVNNNYNNTTLYNQASADLGYSSFQSDVRSSISSQKSKTESLFGFENTTNKSQTTENNSVCNDINNNEESPSSKNSFFTWRSNWNKKTSTNENEMNHIEIKKNYTLRESFG